MLSKQVPFVQKKKQVPMNKNNDVKVGLYGIYLYATLIKQIK